MTRFAMLAMAAVLVACGGNKNVRSSGAEEPTPQWVDQGSGAFSAESGKRLQGVGVVSDVRDAKARRTQADDKARQQLAGTVDALAQGLAKLSESTQDNASDTIAALAKKAALAAPQIRDHWVTADGAESALDSVDLSAFKSALQSVEGDEKLKQEMKNNVNRAFDQLAKK